MDNALILEAPPQLFDDMAAILKHSDGNPALLSCDRVARGIRRKDTAGYSLTLGAASVEIWIERRVGNPTMTISVFPVRKSSDQLAEQVVQLLVAHGAILEC